MKARTTRREFLQDTALVAAAATIAGPADAKSAPAATMPSIKLGKLKVSRLILGSNPFFGFAHGNPQGSSSDMKKWYTEQRIMSVLDQSAERGITAVWTPSYERWISVWNKYRTSGGKLPIWIGQPDKYDTMAEHITACAKNGGKAICIQGACVDKAFSRKKFDLVRKWLDLIHSFDLPAGIATHKPETHLIAEEKKLPTDFYHQCVYQPENYKHDCWEKAIATIRQLDKPVVAYKVLAAGRLAPKKAFADLLKQIKPKDGLCVGVFPKKNSGEIVEDTALVKKLSQRSEKKA
ncbi:MAG: twin-arginine translocation signal domain-containing protein [Phycisphaerae bacterium]|nr:twin-arginine translocation signal domain-containing protein [Phycisphaerae bacterium]